MKSIQFSLVFISAILLVNCSPSKKISGNYTHEVECMGSELDGSITLKTWGKGKNRADALEQARKEAINAVLFIGIRNGKPDCDSRPILNAPNIRENQADYFSTFFKDEGAYKKFVSGKDESFGKKERVQGRDGEVMFGFIVRVLRSDLKKQMISDEILNIEK
ncbi:hypothetical protein [Aurantibacillus circumpalustris]|uniref:hypothetical protein n=1 Tax=Aurantibacillus circumpalustris TaxID=3036359 RepID=UPI00295A9FCD|nr:hypothetical protein [Aurantibacillus circumpalustris]